VSGVDQPLLEPHPEPVVAEYSATNTCFSASASAGAAQGQEASRVVYTAQSVKQLYVKSVVVVCGKVGGVPVNWLRYRSKNLERDQEYHD
jgi:hypothetical protein